ncbi:hypothetical protein KM043_004118 [Ampulex compressa]|nr:hypothetical protein KM043_004118 [Ampulex compressa]
MAMVFEEAGKGADGPSGGGGVGGKRREAGPESKADFQTALVTRWGLKVPRVLGFIAREGRGVCSLPTIHSRAGAMKIATTLFLFVVVGCTWREALGTCVFQSDFGFTLNCAFKKSGLFRIRNLGGVKGYVGLGFSVGDELGFNESFTNTDISKRRSVQNASNRGDYRQVPHSTRQAVPPFKPLPPGATRPMAQQPERQKLVVQQNSTVLKTMVAPSLTEAQQEEFRLQQQRMHQEAKLKQQQRMQQEALALQVLKQQRLQQQEAIRQQHMQKVQQRQKQQQLAAQQQQQRPQQILAAHLKKSQMPQTVGVAAVVPAAGSSITVGNVIEIEQPAGKPAGTFASSIDGLPPFIAMPPSSAQLTDRIGNGPTLIQVSDNEVSKDDFNQLPLPGDDAASSVNEMTLLSLHPIAASESAQALRQQQTEKRQSIPSSLPSFKTIQGMENSLKALAQASNITLEALEAAILLRQQQLMKKQEGPVSTSTTTTSPVKNKYHSGATKVMNAPREYYPMGYDKNFDDNFASRVDLPDTSFYCGDQKHFPGLYADEDLGCMVFHVCALTDDGLIMKSFLCPESTLFDQTILKCNWWFYVDCKASKNLYDSNIPISKSYQLMKALAFFSAYKNHDNGTVNAQENSDNSS